MNRVTLLKAILFKMPLPLPKEMAFVHEVNLNTFTSTCYIWIENLLPSSTFQTLPTRNGNNYNKNQLTIYNKSIRRSSMVEFEIIGPILMEPFKQLCHLPNDPFTSPYITFSRLQRMKWRWIWYAREFDPCEVCLFKTSGKPFCSGYSQPFVRLLVSWTGHV